MAIGKYSISALFLAAICAHAAPQDPNSPAIPAEMPVQEQTTQVDPGGAPLSTQTSPSAPQAETTPDKPVRTGDSDAPAARDAMDMSEVIALLRQQQKDLAEQRKLLQAQSSQIDSLKKEVDILRAPTPVSSEQIVAKTDAASQPLAQAQMSEDSGDAEKKRRKKRETEAGEAVARAQTDDPTRDLLDEFPGAWRLPGTDAALAIGGYVKTSLVYNQDPLVIRDRFIVGSIPVGDSSDDIEAQSSITASQSRLNFDLREPTRVGLLRAFIEGDFASQDDTFRLRHAFGQWNKILAGKTWSAFVDTEASPEEVDFEGLNGRINVRQSQVRIMPTLGNQYEFQLSLEDPNPEIQNGKGVTRTPDIVASGRFDLYRRLHVKLGVIGRQIRGQLDEDLGLGGGLDKKTGWGTTLSGRFTTPRFDERDSLLFQINVGSGIGRYVNDLSSVGDFDGIFNPVTGKLKLFDVTAAYVSFQHWWRDSVRSNFTFGAVSVDNPDFVSGDAYKQTLRFSTNLFWTPTPRIDLGAEFLWGERENEDGENGDATQLQLAARYRF